MKIRVQLETREALPEQEEITRIDNFSCGIASPGSFKYECGIEWARGKDIPVEQVLIFAGEILLSQPSTRDTLGNHISNWENESSRLR